MADKPFNAREFYGNPETITDAGRVVEILQELRRRDNKTDRNKFLPPFGSSALAVNTRSDIDNLTSAAHDRAALLQQIAAQLPDAPVNINNDPVKLSKAALANYEFVRDLMRQFRAVQKEVVESQPDIADKPAAIPTVAKVEEVKPVVAQTATTVTLTEAERTTLAGLVDGAIRNAYFTQHGNSVHRDMRAKPGRVQNAMGKLLDAGYTPEQIRDVLPDVPSFRHPDRTIRAVRDDVAVVQAVAALNAGLDAAFAQRQNRQQPTPEIATPTLVPTETVQSTMVPVQHMPATPNRAFHPQAGLPYHLNQIQSLAAALGQARNAEGVPAQINDLLYQVQFLAQHTQWRDFNLNGVHTPNVTEFSQRLDALLQQLDKANAHPLDADLTRLIDHAREVRNIVGNREFMNDVGVIRRYQEGILHHYQEHYGADAGDFLRGLRTNLERALQNPAEIGRLIQVRDVMLEWDPQLRDAVAAGDDVQLRQGKDFFAALERVIGRALPAPEIKVDVVASQPSQPNVPPAPPVTPKQAEVAILLNALAQQIQILEAQVVRFDPLPEGKGHAEEVARQKAVAIVALKIESPELLQGPYRDYVIAGKMIELGFDGTLADLQKNAGLRINQRDFNKNGIAIQAVTEGAAQGALLQWRNDRNPEAHVEARRTNLIYAALEELTTDRDVLERATRVRAQDANIFDIPIMAVNPRVQEELQMARINETGLQQIKISEERGVAMEALDQAIPVWMGATATTSLEFRIVLLEAQILMARGGGQLPIEAVQMIPAALANLQENWRALAPYANVLERLQAYVPGMGEAIAAAEIAPALTPVMEAQLNQAWRDLGLQPVLDQLRDGAAPLTEGERAIQALDLAIPGWRELDAGYQFGLVLQGAQMLVQKGGGELPANVAAMIPQALADLQANWRALAPYAAALEPLQDYVPGMGEAINQAIAAQRVRDLDFLPHEALLAQVAQLSGWQYDAAGEPYRLFSAEHGPLLQRLAEADFDLLSVETGTPEVRIYAERELAARVRALHPEPKAVAVEIVRQPVLDGEQLYELALQVRYGKPVADQRALLIESTANLPIWQTGAGGVPYCDITRLNGDGQTITLLAEMGHLTMVQGQPYAHLYVNSDVLRQAIDRGIAGRQQGGSGEPEVVPDVAPAPQPCLIVARQDLHHLSAQATSFSMYQADGLPFVLLTSNRPGRVNPTVAQEMMERTDVAVGYAVVRPGLYTDISASQASRVDTVVTVQAAYSEAVYALRDMLFGRAAELNWHRPPDLRGEKRLPRILEDEFPKDRFQALFDAGLLDIRISSDNERIVVPREELRAEIIQRMDARAAHEAETVEIPAVRISIVQRFVHHPRVTQLWEGALQGLGSLAALGGVKHEPTEAERQAAARSAMIQELAQLDLWERPRALSGDALPPRIRITNNLSPEVEQFLDRAGHDQLLAFTLDEGHPVLVAYDPELLNLVNRNLDRREQLAGTPRFQEDHELLDLVPPQQPGWNLNPLPFLRGARDQFLGGVQHTMERLIEGAVHHGVHGFYNTFEPVANFVINRQHAAAQREAAPHPVEAEHQHHDGLNPVQRVARGAVHTIVAVGEWAERNVRAGYDPKSHGLFTRDNPNAEARRHEVMDASHESRDAKVKWALEKIGLQGKEAEAAYGVEAREHRSANRFASDDQGYTDLVKKQQEASRNANPDNTFRR